MLLSEKFCLFRKLVENAKSWSKSNLPLSHSPDRKMFSFKKGLKKLSNKDLPFRFCKTGLKNAYFEWWFVVLLR